MWYSKLVYFSKCCNSMVHGWSTYDTPINGGLLMIDGMSKTRAMRKYRELHNAKGKHIEFIFE